jgi:hypothetical protein
MAVERVKRKFLFPLGLAFLAASTFFLSWLGAFPEKWVEKAYSRPIFPTISHIAALFADVVPFSWFDVAMLFAAVAVVYSIRSRNGWLLLGLASAGYLWFFWSWGVNYHRPPLETRMGLESQAIGPEQVELFAHTAASELNRLWPIVAQARFDRAAVSTLAANRVRSVISKIDGVNWTAPTRIKHSIVAQGWFGIAGIDGMFNPFGHEPIVASTVLSFELPFVESHELAHVRGIPDEGDANLVATLATLASDDAAFQYSGWFYVWLYVRDPQTDHLLDPGPRRDLQIFFDRIRAQQVRWASQLQSTILDWHLKANHVEAGVASYSKFIRLAIATQDQWQNYR